MMMAMNGSDCTPIVRPQWNEPVIIKRILDIGAYGVLVPWVNSKEEAEAAVQACRYPPEGIRGYGPRRASRFDPNYRETANEEILVSVQIETQKALDNLDEIAAVEGVDALFIGPYDLSNNMGFGVPPQWDNPRFLGALEAVLHVCEEHDKAPGLYANMSNIKWAIEKGFIYNTVGEADGFLEYGAEQALKKAKG
jgi:2-keto-3-deoxy-L-rhamnonate aldolase RhmA